jgi:chromosome partitioning protein
MHTLAVVHHKGGVGKTTTTAHLGHALATGPTASKVLLVDLDPQASLTRLVGITPGTGDVGYAAAIEDQQIEPHVSRSDEWQLDVLPAGQRHARIERSTDPGTEQQLRLLLEQAVGQWDHVLIDAPGSLGMLTTTALAAASSGVIVPTTPDYLALEPLKTIIRLINTIQSAYQPGCVLRGVVINARANTREHSHHAAQLQQVFDGQVLGTIPRRTVLQDTASAGLPLTRTHTGPAAGLVHDYHHIARQLSSRLATQGAHQ